MQEEDASIKCLVGAGDYRFSEASVDERKRMALLYLSLEILQAAQESLVREHGMSSPAGAACAAETHCHLQ